MKNKKKRTYLSVKLNILTILTIAAALFGILSAGYLLNYSRTKDYYFAQVETASQEAGNELGAFWAYYFKSYIDTDEFAAVHEKAVREGSEAPIIEWMKGIPSLTEALVSSDTSDSIPQNMYEEYLSLTDHMMKIYWSYSLCDICFMYPKGEKMYYLAFPEGRLMDIGTYACDIPEYERYVAEGSSGIPVSVVNKGSEQVCRACTYISFSEELAEYLSDADASTPVGIAVAEFNMDYLIDMAQSFLTQILILAGILASAAVLLNIFLIRRFASKPLTDLAKAATGFKLQTVEDGSSLGNVIQVDIRGNDEISDLYTEIQNMQHRIIRYTNDISLLTAEKTKAATEMQLAADIQKSMLRDASSAFPGQNMFELAASMDPAREVGGDFYDFFLLDEDHLALIIADVSGKGIPASFFMVESMSLLRSHAKFGLTPAEILEAANNEICAFNKAEMFVTVWIGILDLRTGSVICANAGHEFPILCGDDGHFSIFKDKHGLVVGMMEGVKYRNYEMQLAPGNMLFVYTDGLPEANNTEQEFYGTDRITEALDHAVSRSPEALLNTLRKDVEDFSGGAPQFDDLTMLCVKYNGSNKEES